MNPRSRSRKKEKRHSVFLKYGIPFIIGNLDGTSHHILKKQLEIAKTDHPDKLRQIFKGWKNEFGEELIQEGTLTHTQIHTLEKNLETKLKDSSTSYEDQRKTKKTVKTPQYTFSPSYTGVYSGRYELDDTKMQKEIKKITDVLGPNYNNFFTVDIDTMRAKSVQFQVQGNHSFVSRSKYGDKYYTAFNYTKDITVELPSFDKRSIERARRDILRNQIKQWNGMPYRYTSPAGRNISRRLKVDHKDFTIRVKRLKEEIIPSRINASSKLAADITHDILPLNKRKMCVKCGKIFQPVK